MHLLLHYGALQVQCSDSCSATQWKLFRSPIQYSVIMLQCYSATVQPTTVWLCYSASHFSCQSSSCLRTAQFTIHCSLHYRASAIHCSEYIAIYCSTITGATYCNVFERIGRLCNAVCFNCSALWCIGQDLISGANSNEQSLFLLHGENLSGNIFVDIWQQ